jgi:hypothetical protein
VKLRPRRAAACLALASAIAAGDAIAAPPAGSQEAHDAEEAAESKVPLATAIWIGTQLIPSVGLAGVHGVATFDMRWQVTPLLYSFGVHRGASPLRAFVVEPFVRHVGSIEAYVAPEYLARGEAARERWFFRPGVRAYFPLIERGEYLSCSLGTSYAALPGHGGVAYEAGIYTLFGVVGLQATYAPAREPADWITTLSIRYF